MLDQLREAMRGLVAEGSPFAEDTDVDQVDVQWLRPDLVAEVKFAEWTHEARLRAPVFLRLRPEVAD